MRGFTLVELAVTMAILIALAAVAIPTAIGMREDSRVALTLRTVSTVRVACLRHLTDTGKFAVEDSRSSARTLHTLSLKSNVSGWNGPYLGHPLRASDNPWDGQVIVHPTLDRAVGGGFTTTIGSRRRLRGPGNFVRFTNVPVDAARRIDEEIDNGGNSGWQTRGSVIYRSGKLDVLLAEDVR